MLADVVFFFVETVEIGRKQGASTGAIKGYLSVAIEVIVIL